MDNLTQQLFRLSNHGDSWVLAELSGEEAQKIKPTQIAELYTTGNLGYIDPKKVRGYFIEKLGKHYDGSPQLRIFIDFEDSADDTLIGHYSFFHLEGGEEYHPLWGPILRGDPLDVRYIVDDKSGKFVPITRERVKREIYQGYAGIEKGITAFAEIRDAEKLAKVAGLNFDKELRKLKRADAQAEAKRYQESLPATVGGLAKVMEYASWEMLGESGEIETLENFLSRLPRLTIPRELKEDVKYIIDRYTKLNEESIREQMDVLESVRKMKSKNRRLAEFAEAL